MRKKGNSGVNYNKFHTLKQAKKVSVYLSFLVAIDYIIVEIHHQNILFSDLTLKIVIDILFRDVRK